MRRSTLSALIADVEHFQRRVIQDALCEATGSYWRRRAAVLEASRPRHGDYHGDATREALWTRYDRLTEEAAACRAAAQVAMFADVDELSDALESAA